MKRIDVNEWVLKLRQIENRVDRLALLSQLSQLLNSTLDHQEIQKRAVEAAAQLMKAEAGSLVLVDEQNKTLSVEAPQKKGKRTKPLAFGMEQGIAGWVARNRKSTIVNVPKADARFCKEVDGMGVSKARNLICAPVKIRGKVKGVLEAINKKGEMGFDQEDLSLFTSLADQVAIALDNARHYEDLEEMFFHTAGSIADAIEKRDPYTGGHTQRVTRYSQVIANHLQLKSREKKWLRIASVLHDIGKIGVGDQILKKPAQLSPKEYDEMKNHSVIGAKIIEGIRQLKEIVPGVKYHHEKVDGHGYPRGLKGDAIPILAKIVAVADTYDAMTTNRSYRQALTRKAAIQELRRCSGSQFDKRVVEAFMQALREGEI